MSFLHDRRGDEGQEFTTTIRHIVLRINHISQDRVMSNHSGNSHLSFDRKYSVRRILLNFLICKFRTCLDLSKWRPVNFIVFPAFFRSEDGQKGEAKAMLGSNNARHTAFSISCLSHRRGNSTTRLPHSHLHTAVCLRPCWSCAVPN